MYHVYTWRLRVGLLLVALVLPASGCDLFREDDELFLEPEAYTGDQLRIDGYYYNRSNDLYGSIYFFYRDGTILTAGGAFSNVAAMDAYIVESFLEDSRYLQRNTAWGLFEIEEDTIRFERWYPGDGPDEAYVREGLVLDDTTFHISESYRMVNGQRTRVREKDELYHFRQFSPKPDSTNQFVQ